MHTPVHVIHVNNVCRAGQLVPIIGASRANSVIFCWKYDFLAWKIFEGGMAVTILNALITELHVGRKLMTCFHQCSNTADDIRSVSHLLFYLLVKFVSASLLLLGSRSKFVIAEKKFVIKYVI